MNRVNRLGERGEVREALREIRRKLPCVLEHIEAIQQIPAPTFSESARAEYVHDRFSRLGLANVELDTIGNVYALLTGSRLESGSRPLVVSAHLDSVFPEQVDLSIRREGNILHGAGIGDNATGVAGLIVLAEVLLDFDHSLSSELWFVANVGEEGLGNLRGMRRVVERFGPSARYLVLEGGMFGQISHEGIAVRRYEISASGPGGHAWADFGRPSAVHALAHVVAAIDELPRPDDALTSYNVGVLTGGHSINSIARQAHCLLELRSEDESRLEAIELAVRELVGAANSRFRNSEQTISMTVSEVGRRPSGRVPSDSPLVNWADAALRYVGSDAVRYIKGSTDANLPLSVGAEAVCIGVTKSGNAHREDEFIHIDAIPLGLGQILLVILAATGYGRWLG